MEDVKLNPIGHNDSDDKNKLPSNIQDIKIGQKHYFFKWTGIGWKQLTPEEEYAIKAGYTG